MKNLHIGRWLLGLLVLLASTVPSSAQTYIHVTDVIETGRSGAAQINRFFRKIELGMDSDKKKSFDATISDKMPKGCKLLAPSPGRTQITGLDDQKHTLTVAMDKVGGTTKLQFGLKGVPTIVKNRRCCECSGECGRACTIGFTYRTSVVALPGGLGKLSCAVAPTQIRVNRVSRIRINMVVDGTPLKDAVLQLKIPDSVQGAQIRLAKHSTGLKSVAPEMRQTELATRPGVGNQSFFVELEVRPSKPCKLVLPDFVKLEGKLTKPIRPLPTLNSPSKVVREQTSFSVVKSDLVISASTSTSMR